MTTIKELKSIRWVDEAEEHTNADGYKGYRVSTKADTLKIYLRSKIRNGHGEYDWEYDKGPDLPEPVAVYLPRYWVYLQDPADTTSPFRFKLIDEPKAIGTYIGTIPQYQTLTNITDWDSTPTPCYGRATDEIGGRTVYMETKTWKERAKEAVIYLQSAVPHYGNYWYLTSFAYRLGLVGEEYLEVPEVKTAAEAASGATQLTGITTA